MLYDKRWDKKVKKPDPLDINTLIAWLETKTPKEWYCYYDQSGECLFSQYLTHLGHPISMSPLGSRRERSAFAKWEDLHHLYNNIAAQAP